MTGAARLESVVQVGILLIMGGTAGAASFKHIHDLTVANGQPGWIGWANAVVVELMSIAAGLELRRRKRTGQSTGFVHSVLFAAVVVSLAAQVARAESSVWGWIVAALPALGFLAVVKIVLTRTPVVSGPDQIEAVEVGPAETAHRPTEIGVGPVESADRSTEPDEWTHEAVPANSSLVEQVLSETADGPDEAERWDVDQTVEDLVVPLQRINGSHVDSSRADTTDDESQRSRSGPHRTRTGPARDHVDVSGPDRKSDLDVSGPDRRSDTNVSGLDRTGPDDDLLELGKTIATEVAMRRGTLTRKVLTNEIRRKGRTIGTDRATQLLQQLKMAEGASVGAD